MTKNMFRNMTIALAVLLVVGLGGFWLNFTEAGSYILDINPSVQINVNRMGNVTSVEPLNADGEAVLVGFRLRDRDLDDVIEKLVDRLILSGYLKADNKNFIMISSDGKEPVSIAELKQFIYDQMQVRQVNGSVVTKHLDDDLFDDDFYDDDLEMSAAKLDFIRQLNRYDNTLTLDSLKNMTVEDLMILARKNNVDLDDLFDDCDEDWDDLYDDEDNWNDSLYGDGDDWNDSLYDDDDYVAPAPQPSPQPVPAPVPAPAPVYYNDDSDYGNSDYGNSDYDDSDYGDSDYDD